MVHYIPNITIHDEFVTGVDGICSAKTSGYVHVPIYIDCMSKVGCKLGKVELNLEVHVIEGLPVDLIVGIDAICAYGIDTIISHSIVTLSVNQCELAFPIKFRRTGGARDPASSDDFPVLCRADTLIPSLHQAQVSVVLGFKPPGDAWLHPVPIKNDNRVWSPLDGG